jgi:peptide/nickel transport system permease protein
MLKYTLKRIVYFIPTLLIISLVTFGLSKITPGDPVKLALGNTDKGGESGQAQEKMASEKSYYEKAENLGLNLPTFYTALSSISQPDSLYKIIKKGDRETLTDLISLYGNWDEISKYYQQIKAIEYSLFDIQADSSIFTEMKEIRQNLNMLYLTSDDFDISNHLNNLDKNSASSAKLAQLHSSILGLKAQYNKIKSEKTIYKNYIPSIKWYGFKNQYHRWLFGDAPWFFGEPEPGQVKGFLRGDFGKSYLDGRPISSKLKDAIPWTLMMNIIVILMGYVISIPLGISSAVHKGSRKERVTTIMLFVLYSLPSFWIATMLITFFTTDEYGMNFFPTFGVGEVDEDMSFGEVFGIRAYHLFLPVLCLTYGGIAYLSRQMRAGMLATLGQDYIRTARAKGNPEKTVIWKHAFRNSLIPIITIFSAIFPAVIAGSFIIEWIFSIPGMGKLSLEALTARDFPMIFTVMMLAAILTLIGNLVADILYGVVDPRISFDK